MFRGFEKLILDSCTLHAGGGVLIGGPFAGSFVPTQEDHEASRWYICKYLSFEPSFRFREEAPGDEKYMPWPELKQRIPGWIREECRRIRDLRREGP